VEICCSAISRDDTQVYCTCVLACTRVRVLFCACYTYSAQSLEKTRRAHPHYRARKTGRCSFRTTIIYPGVTDWSLEQRRDNARGRRRNPWTTMCVLRTRMRAIDPTVARAIRMASSCVSLWIDVDPRSSRISLTSLARYRYVILLQLADVEAFCTCVGRMCLPPNSNLVPSSSRSSHTYLTRNTISSIAIIFKG